MSILLVNHVCTRLIDWEEMYPRVAKAGWGTLHQNHRSKNESMGKKPYLYLFSIIILLSCQKQYNHRYWLQNGIVFQNINWEIALSVSSNVLQSKGNIWVILVMPDSVPADTSVSRHVQLAKPSFPRLFGRVEHEIIHDSAAISREFYRFTKDGVELLGYKSSVRPSF